MRLLYFSRDYTTHDHRYLSALAQSTYPAAGAGGREGEPLDLFYLRLERQSQEYESRPVPSAVTHVPWAGGQAPARKQDGPRLLRDLRRVLREVKPDLVLAGPLQRSAFLAALAGAKPLVSMSWGYDLLHDVHKGRDWAWATRFTLRRSAAMVGDCDTIRNLAVQHGMNPNRIITFPWGADIQHFAPGWRGAENPLRQRWGWGDDAFVLLSTRSWSPLYGVEDLARAFVRAIQRRPELRLLMLGGGPQSALIKGIFTRAGVLDAVHFPGQVGQEALPDYFRAADLYISTSHSDGTSISLLEALGCGTPVLLTDIPGNQEWITRQGELGWLYPDGDVAALEQAILHAVEQRTGLPQMGVNARRLAETRADWNQNFPRIFEAFDLALKP